MVTLHDAGQISGEASILVNGSAHTSKSCVSPVMVIESLPTNVMDDAFRKYFLAWDSYTPIPKPTFAFLGHIGNIEYSKVATQFVEAKAWDEESAFLPPLHLLDLGAEVAHIKFFTRMGPAFQNTYFFFSQGKAALTCTKMLSSPKQGC